MKKLLILLVAFYATASVVNAQVKFGLQGGAVYNWESSDIAGYTFGLGVDIPLSKNWLIQPNLNVFPLGSKTTTTESKTNSFYSSTFQTTVVNTEKITTETESDVLSINMPVFLAYRFNLSDNLGLLLGAGTYADYAFSGKTKTTITTTRTQSFRGQVSTSTNTNKLESDTKAKFSYGSALRAGFSVYGLSLTVDYTGYDSEAKKFFGSKSLRLGLGYTF